MNSRSAASIASRLVAAVALGAVVALGTTGCTFMTNQATTIDYSPSDGVNVDATGGDIVVRNAMVIATEDGSTGNLVGAFVNTGDKSGRLNIDIAGTMLTVRVPAGDSVSLGADKDPLPIDGLNVMPGSNVEALFVSGNGEAAATEIPVLDGTLPEYSDLVPSAGE
ncbi:DNA modification methylase [Microbacterium esteraromaticum]|uniref:DNA modification methylase n=1 Tax=Microbacterium esteraromaticum TaxID=57043 RepID=UPI00236776C1|nr:DNA modification methylase [Microbacterium esteraromaticum]WDH78143.1 DNA modification methylase [Microbacterium esteraromaticum]